MPALGWRELIETKWPAFRGFRKADTLVGRGYDAFYGVRRKRNVREALRCYQAAADMGHPSGWTNLALCYMNGDGVRKNLRRSFACFVRAASLGQNRAKIRVACALIDGLGVKRDARTGIVMLRALALRDDDACREIAERFLDGNGVRKNVRNGLRWLRQGATRGSQDCQNALGAYLHDHIGTPQAYREAVRWYRRAVSAGRKHAFAYNNLSNSYEEGDGVPKNDRLAVKWLLKAVEFNRFAEEPCLDAYVRLARRLLEGNGIERSRPKAVQMLRKVEAKRQDGDLSQEAERDLRKLRRRLSAR